MFAAESAPVPPELGEKAWEGEEALVAPQVTTVRNKYRSFVFENASGKAVVRSALQTIPGACTSKVLVVSVRQ